MNPIYHKVRVEIIFLHTQYSINYGTRQTMQLPTTDTNIKHRSVYGFQRDLIKSCRSQGFIVYTIANNTVSFATKFLATATVSPNCLL